MFLDFNFHLKASDTLNEVTALIIFYIILTKLFFLEFQDFSVNAKSLQYNLDLILK